LGTYATTRARPQADAEPAISEQATTSLKNFTMTPAYPPHAQPSIQEELRASS
jgi:hypothetical protein